MEKIALSLLWRWAKPDGNTNKPKIKTEKDMKEQILKDMAKKNRSMLGNSKIKSTSASSQARSSQSRPKSLAGFVKEKTRLWKTYKKSGKTYKAFLLPSGKFEYQGAEYSSPSAAAKQATGRGTNGWVFWRVSYQGQWMTLDEFVKKPRLNKA